MMAGRILITRPRAQAESFAKLLEERGLRTLICPLTEIRFKPKAHLQEIEFQEKKFQAVVVTSANALEALRRVITREEETLFSLPLFAIGTATEKKARSVGFTKIFTAGSSQKTLAALLKERVDPHQGAVFYPAGRHRAGDLQKHLPSYQICLVELYAACAIRKLPDHIIRAFCQGDISVVCFFSQRAARIFVELVRGYDMSGVRAVCLSGAIADRLSSLYFAEVGYMGDGEGGGARRMADRLSMMMG